VQHAAVREPNVERIMKPPFVAIAGDAGIRAIETTDKPHPRGCGNIPRVRGHHVREREVIELSLAARKMTTLPADCFGIRERGVVRESVFADLVVFDPKTILDRATYEDPTEAPTGIDWVIVNARSSWITGCRRRRDWERCCAREIESRRERIRTSVPLPRVTP
jgi:dihydroorotase/N-acyl-D-amino-acid deacylase